MNQMAFIELIARACYFIDRLPFKLIVFMFISHIIVSNLRFLATLLKVMAFIPGS